jgi:hypothetical protein
MPIAAPTPPPTPPSPTLDPKIRRLVVFTGC